MTTNALPRAAVVNGGLCVLCCHPIQSVVLALIPARKSTLTPDFALIRDLKPLTGHTRYLFPGARDLNRPMSENTINAALARIGYDGDTMTGHGFRHTASTLLNEKGFNKDAIER